MIAPRLLVRSSAALAFAVAAATLTSPLGAPSASADPAGAQQSASPKVVLAPTITALVSATPTGGSGNDYGESISMSTDGRLVAWRDASTNLVAGDTNGSIDAFVRDMVTDVTERVDVSTSGSQALGGVGGIPSITRDGRYVAFDSSAPNLAAGDTNAKVDVFVRDRVAKTTERVSVASDETQGNGDSWEPVITPDGRYVAFISDATQLVGGDTNGKRDVFVRDRQLGTTTRISVSSAEAQGTGASDGPSITPNGRYVAFHSDAADLVASDTNGAEDVFRRDIVAGTTIRVSVKAGGGQGTGGNSGSDRQPISDDGNRITFVSAATDLVTGDTNAALDVFQRNVSSNTTIRVNLGPGGAQANGNAYRPDASSDGDVVVFGSLATNLVAGDTNGSSDVFSRTISTSTTARQSITTAGGQLADGGISQAISPDGSAVAFGSDSGDVVATPTPAGTVFVRKRLSVAPFTSVSGFVAQQVADFGTGRTASQQQADVNKILSGFPSYQRYVTDQAHATGWSGKRASVIRLYWAFFLRAPDTGGITYWIGRLQAGKTLNWVAQSFAKSSEFQNKYGALKDPKFVGLVYLNVLSRPADAAGLAHWVAKLDGGMTRGQMMVQFSESSEGKRKLAPQTDVVLVSLAMLRAVPAPADFATWRTTITDGGAIEDVVTEILATSTYASRITP